MNTNSNFMNAAWLRSEDFHGYGNLPIPVEQDEKILSLIRTWNELDSSERLKECLKINAGQRDIFLSFSERMASRAVRENNKECIVFGLLALGIDGWRDDWRENIALLSLHYDACKKINLSPKGVFLNASSFLSPNVGMAFVSFLKRETQDKSIESMGFKESVDKNGFRYERSW